MIFDERLSNNSPESIILAILSQKVRISTKELYEFYSQKAPEKITIQGFYKVIRQMLKNRILVKDSSLLSLDSFWINNLLRFAENLKENFLKNKIGMNNVILEEGESKAFTFENIITMDNFWAHALNMVNHFYTQNEHFDKNAYSRNYFSVFQLARTQSENMIIKNFEFTKINWYMASGSSTFLNKLIPKLVEGKNYQQFIYDFKSYEKKYNNKNYWVTVIGDFVFEATLPKYIFELIEKIYQEVNDISEFNADKINYLFHEPGKSTLTIFRDKKRAENIRKEIFDLYNKYAKKKN